MATHRISLGLDLLPHDSNSYIAPYSNANSGTTQDFMCARMSGTADSALKGSFVIPENYVGTPRLLIMWSSQTTAGNCYFELRHRTMTPGTDKLDISTTPTERSDTVTTASKPGAADDLEQDAITLTSTDLTAGELVYFEFWRQASSQAGDTKTDLVEIVALEFEYADA